MSDLRQFIHSEGVIHQPLWTERLIDGKHEKTYQEEGEVGG